MSSDEHLFQGSAVWFYCKWKEAYVCLIICCSRCVFDFKCIVYQIVLLNCAPIASLNEMI